MIKLSFYSIIILFYVICSSGCSTIRTVSHYTLNSPKLYSGSRMDLDAMNQNQDYVIKKYNVGAPLHPLFDLPFSFLFDTIIFFPVALPVAMSVAIFD
jgi:uncharacterized protein YceK